MLIKVRTLVFLTIATFIVASCITIDKSLGGKFVPDNQNLTLYSAEIPLPIEGKLLESVQGCNSTTPIIGSFNTPEFGQVEFSTAGNLTLPATGRRFGKDIKVISTYLLTTVQGNQTLDPKEAEIPQNILIYRTKEALDSTKLSNTSLSLSDCEPNPINVSTTYFGGDSLVVYLDNKLGEEILSATEEQLDTLNLFTKRFRALYIKTESANSNFGGRITKLGAPCIYIRYNFQPTWAEGLSRKDTLVPIYVGRSYYSNCGAFLNISKFSSSSLETSSATANIPVEGLGGIKPYINHKKLKSVLNDWCAKNNIDPTKVVISRATYKLPYPAPVDLDAQNNTAPSLFHIFKDTSNPTYPNYQVHGDCYSEANLMGDRNGSLNIYQGDCSSYIQRMVNKDITELNSSDDIWFAPITVTTDNYTGITTYNLDMESYYVGSINGAAHSNAPKLTILYTVLK